MPKIFWKSQNYSKIAKFTKKKIIHSNNVDNARNTRAKIHEALLEAAKFKIRRKKVAGGKYLK